MNYILPFKAMLGLTCDMCDLYCTVWNKPPPPETKGTDKSAIFLIKGRLAVFPKDTLTGDVLDEPSEVVSPCVTQVPHKTLSCCSFKEKKTPVKI